MRSKPKSKKQRNSEDEAEDGIVLAIAELVAVRKLLVDASRMTSLLELEFKREMGPFREAAKTQGDLLRDQVGLLKIQVGAIKGKAHLLEEIVAFKSILDSLEEGVLGELKLGQENPRASRRHFKVAAQALGNSVQEIKVLSQQFKRTFVEKVSSALCAVDFGSGEDATVVSVDMEGYGEFSRVLQDKGSIDAAAKLLRELQSWLDQAVDKASKNSDRVFRVGTGDGGLLLFRSPEEGVTFAMEFQRVVQGHNAKLPVADDHRHFRIGIVTGEVAVAILRGESGNVKGVIVAGSSVVKSVRLQAKAHPGGMLVCRTSWGALPVQLKGELNGRFERVKGKEGERPAYMEAVRWRAYKPKKQP